MAKPTDARRRTASRPARRAAPDANAAERRRYQRVLARCTPTAQQYRAYREDVDLYIEATHGRGRPLSMHGVVGAVRKLERRPSILFRREYLIAWVDAAWLARVAPACDAIASNLEPLGAFEPPPMIILPDTKRRSRSQEFTAIVEHEMIHINQALRGDFRWAATPATGEELLHGFFTHTAMEFDAEFLQRTSWPHAPLARLGLSLPRWCLLRGYTQALEHILRDLAHERLDEALATSFLSRVLAQARRRLRGLGLARGDLAWFEARWARDVFIALTVLESQGIDLTAAVRVRPVLRWLKARPEFQSASS